MNGMSLSDEADLVLIVTAIILFLAYSIYIFSIKKKKAAIYSFILWTIAWTGIMLILLKPALTIGINSSPAVVSQEASNLTDRLKAFDRYESINDFLISDSYSSTDTLYIKDQVLSSDDLDHLEHIKIIYIPSQISGISYINHERAVEGSPIHVRGIATPQEVKSIEFHFADRKLAAISPDEGGAFYTDIKVSTAGDYLMDVFAITERDTISEKWALKVHPRSTLRFLLLNEFPTFESNYLKNYLSEYGHQVAVRSQVSQNKYVTSFSNMTRMNLNQITPSIINSYDVTVISIAYWNNIGSSVRANILEAIYSSGKALVLTPSQNSSKAKNLPYHEVSGIETTVFKNGPVSVPLNVYDIKTNQAWDDILFQGTKVATTTDLGIGTISITAISQSYPFLLTGNKEIFNLLWTTILSDLVGIDEVHGRLIMPEMIWEGQLESVFFYNPPNHQGRLKWNRSSYIPVAYLPFTPGIAAATFYPVEGWNQFEFEDLSKIETFYVYGQSSWPLVRINNAQVAAKNHNDSTNKIESAERNAHKEISYVWGILLFFSGMGGLWLKERMGI